MNPRRHLLAVSALLTAGTFAQDPDPNDPAAELASFRLAEGFEANLFASEKDGVVKPIQIRWDTRGRLWVIQSTTYPQLRPGEEPNDKVLILEDTDGDGRADKTTVFADGLMIPTGLEIAPTNGTTEHTEGTEKGNRDATKAPLSSSVSSVRSVVPSACYVGEGTKLWLLTDTDGDGQCDKREVVLRGFGTGDNHQNINSFRWSPGGELFFSQGLHAHSRVETPHGIVKLDHAGFFRFRPREQRLDAFYGGHADPQNPWGFVWTDWGQMLMVAGNNGGIFWPLPEMIRGVQNGKRDNLWVNARGRKTSGPDIVGTAHFPDDWQGNFITGGYISNAIWALRIEDDGAGFRLVDRELPAEEKESGVRGQGSEKTPAANLTPDSRPLTPSADAPRTDEANPAAAAPPRRTTQPLLASTHGSFRPVDVKFGPDGALYVCDWFNPIIGHYQSSFRHPDRDKTHGRIWRITAKGRPLVKPPPIAGAPVEALLENLKSPERYVREQSKRELAGRETEEVIAKARAWWPKVVEAALSRSDVPPPSSADEGGKDAAARERSEAARPADRAASTTAERALCEVLGVFEAHDVPDASLLQRLVGSKSDDARAYAAGVIARWQHRLKESDTPNVIVAEGPVAVLTKLSAQEPARVRAAAAVALGNILQSDSVVALAMTEPLGDRFVELALRSSIAALRPMIEEMRGNDGQFGTDRHADLFSRIDRIERPSSSQKKTSAPSVVPKPALLPATGQLRATPEFVAALVKEVRASGDAKRGAEVFRRAELTCTVCHSIEDKGGKIGPPLDTIGSGQPLDFIIGATLEPQREIKESYEAMQMTAKDGRIAIGYIAQRTAEGTTLRDAATGAETRFAAAEIAEFKPIGSLMPAGLVDRLSREDLRDLFRYLSELGKPK